MSRRLPVVALNPHLSCVLCEGYLIEATTVAECLHSFCRTCIARYLENSKFCPVCDVQVHETKPLQGIRFDQTLQDIVYKLIPGLYQNEMQRRREFYAEHPEAALQCSSEERGEGAEQKFFYSPDETISLTLEYHCGSKDVQSDSSSEKTIDSEKNAMTRHLNCPAALSVAHLKKFIAMKFSLPQTYMVEILYADHILRDDYTLMDIAYIYSWKRAGPMKFHYNITKRVPRRWEIPSVAPKQPNPVINTEPGPTRPSSDAVCNLPVAPGKKSDPEAMDVDEAPATSGAHSEISEVKKVSPPAACDKINSSKGVALQSSSPSVQEMEVSKAESATPVVHTSPCDAPMPSALPYGDVKVVSTSKTNTILSTANGVRLKFIHPVQVNQRGRPRKYNKKNKSKSAPVQRLARLAPYPPPNTPTPAACIPTQPITHLPSLGVGKLVPSMVMTSLSPALVTTMVSSTTNTLCNAARSSLVTQVGTFVNPSAICSITSSNNSTVPSVIPTVSSSVQENSIQQSSSSSVVNASNSLSSYDSSLSGSHTMLAVIQNQNSVKIIPPMSNTSSVEKDTSEKVKAVHLPAVSTACAVPISTSNSILPSPIVPIDKPKDSLSKKTVSNAVSSTSVSVDSNSNVQISKQNVIGIPPVSSTETVVLTPTVSTPADKCEQMECETSVGLTSLPVVSAQSKVSESPQKKIVISPEKSPLHKSEAKVNGDSHVINSPIQESMFCKSSESYKNSVKNSISAEFSDNDDLGCQPDLVVDEQKMDSSDNEDDTDAALRKKITAIAEKEDEADITDDTEADSGRASDISSHARSSCDDDIGSPAPLVPADRSVTSTAAPQLPSFSAPVSTSAPATPMPAEENHRPSKVSSLHDVIDNLYRQKKDNIGALDLSVCTRKLGEGQNSRQKAVANPVLDIKHRQQTYLPAPSKQHTACPPAPKHPTSPSLLMHQLSVHHHNMMSSHAKSSHLQVPVQCTNMTYPSPACRSVSSPSSIAGRSTPTCNNSHAIVPPVPSAHQGMMSFLPGILPYNTSLLTSFAAGKGGMNAMLPLPGRSTPSAAKSVQSPPPAYQNKTPNSKQSSASSHRKSSGSDPSKSPLHRGSPMMSPAPCIQVSHPRASPSLMRMVTQHRSASPAPNPKTKVPITTAQVTTTTSSPSYKPSQPPIPIYKKSDSYKSYNSKFRGSNLTVFNPDPNGYRQKIVIKNLDVRPNNNHR